MFALLLSALVVLLDRSSGSRDYSGYKVFTVAGLTSTAATSLRNSEQIRQGFL